MPEEDLLALADKAVRAYFDGSIKSKLSVFECMTALRVEVRELQKERAKAETARIEKRG